MVVTIVLVVVSSSESQLRSQYADLRSRVAAAPSVVVLAVRMILLQELLLKKIPHPLLREEADMLQNMYYIQNPEGPSTQIIRL